MSKRAKKKESEKEFVLTVTEKEYQEGLKRGWTDDDMLKPGRHVFRRLSPERFAKWNSQPRKITVHVNLPLDYEVLEYFKKRAAETNAESLEKFINDTLRAMMEAETKDKAENESAGFEKLVDDERFINAVAERVEKRIRA